MIALAATHRRVLALPPHIDGGTVGGRAPSQGSALRAWCCRTGQGPRAGSFACVHDVAIASSVGDPQLVRRDEITLTNIEQRSAARTASDLTSASVVVLTFAWAIASATSGSPGRPWWSPRRTIGFGQPERRGAFVCGRLHMHRA